MNLRRFRTIEEGEKLRRRPGRSLILRVKDLERRPNSWWPSEARGGKTGKKKNFNYLGGGGNSNDQGDVTVGEPDHLFKQSLSVGDGMEKLFGFLSLMGLKFMAFTGTEETRVEGQGLG